MNFLRVFVGKSTRYTKCPKKKQCASRFIPSFGTKGLPSTRYCLGCLLGLPGLVLGLCPTHSFLFLLIISLVLSSTGGYDTSIFFNLLRVLPAKTVLNYPKQKQCVDILRCYVHAQGLASMHRCLGYHAGSPSSALCPLCVLLCVAWRAVQPQPTWDGF